MYSLIIGVIGLYGIYLAFLQFLIDKSDTFLGKNKTKYIINNSIWYTFTQTELFLLIFLLFTFIPIILIRYSNLEYLLYLWQTTYVVLLTVYIFLIKLNLDAVYVLFLIKDKTDIGMRMIIENQVMYKYFDLWRHKKYLDYVSYLKADIIKVSKDDISTFLDKIFLNNIFYEYKDDERKIFKDNAPLFDLYITEKWQTIEQYKDYIKPDIYEELLKDDLNMLLNLWSKRKNNSIFQSLFRKMYKKLIKHFFNNYNTKILFKNIYILNLDMSKFDNKDFRAKINSEEIEYLIDYYLDNEIDADISRIIATIDCSSNAQDILFKSLTSYVHKIRQNMHKLIKIQDLFDYEHRIAYIIYVLMYPDKRKLFDWTENFLELSKILDDDLWVLSDESKLKIGELLDNTIEKHRINSIIFNKIVDDRNQIISTDSYFDKFGKKSRLSYLVILYFELMCNKDYRFSIPQSKIQVTTNTLQIRKKLSKEYLLAVAKNANVLKIADLEACMHVVIKNTDLKDEIKYVGINIIDLLYLEFVYDDVQFRNTMKKVLLSIFSYTSHLFATETIFEFVILKMGDSKYNDIFSNTEFLECVKLYGIPILDMLIAM